MRLSTVIFVTTITAAASLSTTVHSEHFGIREQRIHRFFGNQHYTNTDVLRAASSTAQDPKVAHEGVPTAIL